MQRVKPPPFQSLDQRDGRKEWKKKKKNQQQCALLLLNLQHTGGLFSPSPFPRDVLIGGPV